MDDLNITQEFLEENKKLCQTMPKRKGGRFTKQEKQKRLDEVHKLHFEYGYSARRIAELMQVNRNTINADIYHWYDQIRDSVLITYPEYPILVYIQRLEVQYTRLREILEKTESFQEKMSLEKMILDIDSKVLNTYHRLAESTKRNMDVSTEYLNEYMKKHHKSDRFMLIHDTYTVSKKNKEKIDKIIDEDKSLRFF